MNIELVPWQLDDAQCLSGLIEKNIEHLRPWMAWIRFEPISLENRQELIRTWIDESISSRSRVYKIVVDNVVVGSCALLDRVNWYTLEIGYWISHEYLRRGIIKNSVIQVCEIAWKQPEIKFVELHIDENNIASAGVAKDLHFEVVRTYRKEPEGIVCNGKMLVWQRKKPEA